MNKLLSTILLTAMMGIGAAQAADLAPKGEPIAPPAPATPDFDVSIGLKAMTDDNFRGISQSDRKPSGNLYIEAKYLWIYAGTSIWRTKLPSDPLGEVDLYAGIRPTFGPFTFDLGVMYYWYPDETQFANGAPGARPTFANGNVTLKDTDFTEFYGKVSFNYKDTLLLGVAVYHSQSWLNTGAPGTYYSATAKYTLPTITGDLGWFVSGELGRYALGTTKFDPFVFNPKVKLPDYTYWNAGVGFTYKVFTLDLRYHDTDLKKTQCNILTGDPGARPGGGPIPFNGAGLRSNWCSQTFIATLSMDTTLSSLGVLK